MPVDRADLLQAVGDVQDSDVTLTQPEEWPWPVPLRATAFPTRPLTCNRTCDGEIKDTLARRVCGWMPQQRRPSGIGAGVGRC